MQKLSMLQGDTTYCKLLLWMVYDHIYFLAYFKTHFYLLRPDDFKKVM